MFCPLVQLWETATLSWMNGDVQDYTPDQHTKCKHPKIHTTKKYRTFASLIPRLFPRVNESDGSLVGPGNKARHLLKYTIILQHTPCNFIPEVDNHKDCHRFIKDDIFTKLETSCTGVMLRGGVSKQLASPVVVGEHPA